MNPSQKLRRLEKIISNMGSLVVAFSGGLDSTFLLKVAGDTLPKEKVLAVTADSKTYPREELLFSKRMARLLGARHKIIRTKEFEDKNFISNTLYRCYFCKRELFSRLKDIAARHKLAMVVDASTLSDKKDFRPGNKAKEEFGVRSPLIEARITKEDVRTLSRELGLRTWDKPSLACLASRLPYGTRIDLKVLARIERAEKYLRTLGFHQVRLRHYDGLCRIEVEKEAVSRLLSKRNLVVEKLKKLGYNYVTVDLEGYRTGSMNEAISASTAQGA